MPSGQLRTGITRLGPRLGVFATGLLVACGAEPPDPVLVTDLASYRRDIVDWHTARLERLRGRNGYLNLAGLFWLRDGQHRMGASPNAEIPLPAGKAPDLLGTLTATGGRVVFAAAEGVAVQVNGEPVTNRILADDTEEAVDVVTYGSLAWFIIRRGSQLGVRLRDYENEALASFPGIERFPIDVQWRVPARLERYPEARRLAVDTVVDGLMFEPLSPGVLVFEMDGRSFELEAYADDEGLFILFADGSSGVSTYGAGRFLTAPPVDENSLTVLDFNRAYNPPCAFNDYATCPIAPLGNRLPIAIEAGERYSPRLHVAGR